jgi:large repetitive protein
VRVIKLIDGNASPSSPSVKAQVPAVANVGETIHLSAQTEAAGVPAVEYHWDFGDGSSANGPKVSYAYTRAANFTIRLTVDGADGVPAVQSFSVNVIGNLRVLPKLTDNRRFRDPTDR